MTVTTGANLKGALEGVTILDLTRVLSGPYCTMLLADMGARVIKIEHPEHGDDTRGWGPPFLGDESAYFLSVNRNKESVTLDFKHPKGRDVLNQLIEQVDVLVENFRPGTMKRAGFGYNDLAARLPNLIYASVSGFGQTGPRHTQPGYDAVLQAEGGLMSITGDADGPAYRLGVAISDITAGMFAAYGVVLALFARDRTGRGQMVDVGMLDAVSALLTYQAEIHLTTGVVPPRMGNRHPTITPYETFDASDGEFVVAVGNDEQWKRLCKVIDQPELGNDPHFNTNRARVAAHDQLQPLLAQVFKSRTRKVWIECLNEAGIPCGAVRNIAEVLADPQLAAREMIVSLNHPTVGPLKMLGVPTKLSDTPGAVRTPPPTLGQHTEYVLTELLDLSADEIVALQKAGAI